MGEVFETVVVWAGTWLFACLHVCCAAFAVSSAFCFVLCFFVLVVFFLFGCVRKLLAASTLGELPTNIQAIMPGFSLHKNRRLSPASERPRDLIRTSSTSLVPTIMPG